MWQSIKSFFRNSETLFLARLQMAIGAIAEALTYVDPAMLQPVIGDAEWFPWFVLLNGLATEWLRRRRADDLE